MNNDVDYDEYNISKNCVLCMCLDFYMDNDVDYDM